MLNSHDKVKIYEGNREAGTFTGMIFSLTLDEVKRFNWDFDKYFYNIEGVNFYNKEDINKIIKKLDTAHNG